MKIKITFDIAIDGNITQREVRDKFFQWFVFNNKLSPTDKDDEYQVWIEGAEMKSR